MKKLITIIFFCILSAVALSQDAKSYYEQAMKKAEGGQLNEAISLFDKSIELDGNDYNAWYYRALAKSMNEMYEEAIPDFSHAIKMAPDKKQAYFHRAACLKNLTDYDAAISDYSTAIKLYPKYGEAWYNRGVIYDLLGKKDLACSDFMKANEAGMKQAERKIEKCNSKDTAARPVTAILRLTKTAPNNKYGFTKENPVKAGTGPEGGPANERAYFSLLRDKIGKPVKYKRISSCCPYESPNAMFGMAMLDRYEITWLDENNKEQNSTVYISFYDYDEPMILHGFNTVKPLNKN